jgi:zinc protease
MLDVQVDFAAGSCAIPRTSPGVAALTAACSTRAAGMDETPCQCLADLGARLSGGADIDRASVSLRTLAADDKRTAGASRSCVPGARAAVSEPTSSSASGAHHRRTEGVADTARETLPHARSGALYPGHPYGRDVTPESVVSYQGATIWSSFIAGITRRRMRR